MAQKNAERLLPVSVEGPAPLLEAVLARCCTLLRFPGGSMDGAAPEGEESDPFERLLCQIERVADNAQLPLQRERIGAALETREEIAAFVSGFWEQFTSLRDELAKAEEETEQAQNLLTHLRHLSEMTLRLEDILRCKYLRVRFGRLPVDSEGKLGYYSEHIFLFFPFSSSGAYTWGMVLTTNEHVRDIDNILDALYFERVRVPGGIRGTPAEAAVRVQEHYLCCEEHRRKAGEELRRLTEENDARFSRCYSETLLLGRMERCRKAADVYSARFFLTGLVSKEDAGALRAAVAELGGVKVEPLARKGG